MYRYKTINFVLLSSLCLALSACAVGPDYKKPTQNIGASFKEQRQQGWVSANPADSIHKGNWWELYQDTYLNKLVEQANQANQTIAQAAAQFQAAQATTASSRSDLFPTISASSSSQRGSSSGSSNGSTSASSGTDFSSSQGRLSQQTSVGASLSWEIDLWGKLRRQLEGSKASEQASAADLANVRLSIQSELLTNYFQLRILDTQKTLLQNTVASYERSLNTNKNKYKQGVVARADVVSAQAQLENAKVQLIDIDNQRNQLEHAIAVLTGQPPSALSIEPVKNYLITIPTVPAGIPATLLQRRPDIASAERLVANANAQIGVAKSAWFPDLSFSASYGLRSSAFMQWLSAPLTVWSLGPSLAMTLIDGGARSAQVDKSEANYQAQVASYRQTVLTALQEVEDALSSSRVLAQEDEAQTKALAASRESLKITRNQYKAGLIDYLSLAQVETSTNSAERTALQLKSQRLVASVNLIKALGGGWNSDGLKEQ